MPIAFNVKTAISLIFAAATLTCHFNSGRRVCMPPLLSRACMLRQGWRRRFQVTGTQRQRKLNEILTRVQCAPQLQTTTLKTKLCALYSRFYGSSATADKSTLDMHFIRVRLLSIAVTTETSADILLGQQCSMEF